MPDIAIFAVTQRTGSTLVQRIFNASPLSLVWGEGGRALMHFLEMERNGRHFSHSMADARSLFLADPRPLDLDTSCMSPDEPQFHKAVVAAVRTYMRELYPASPGLRTGFKEVLHPASAVDLFREAFPLATIVLLARHPVSVWHSLPPDWNVRLEDMVSSWRDNVEGYSSRGKMYWFEDLIYDPSTQLEIAGLAEISIEALFRVLSFRVKSSAHVSRRTPDEIGYIIEECGALIPQRIRARVEAPAS